MMTEIADWIWPHMEVKAKDIKDIFSVSQMYLDKMCDVIVEELNTRIDSEDGFWCVVYDTRTRHVAGFYLFIIERGIE